MLVLGIETSCDDTAVAVLRDGREILANFVSSQDHVHGPFGGVVPELASRQHSQNLVPLMDAALQNAGVNLAISTASPSPTARGSSAPCWWGCRWSRAWRFAGISRMSASIIWRPICWQFSWSRRCNFPYVALLASGGHTLLYLVRDVGQYLHLGGTRDDAAGEAFDKVAKMMGLGYPGGRIIDNLAKDGDAAAIRFPRARFGTASYEFSFSGIKTAVWQYLKTGGAAASARADIAASFQEAVVDMLVQPAIRQPAPSAYTASCCPAEWRPIAGCALK